MKNQFQNPSRNKANEGFITTNQSMWRVDIVQGIFPIRVKVSAPNSYELNTFINFMGFETSVESAECLSDEPVGVVCEKLSQFLGQERGWYLQHNRDRLLKEATALFNREINSALEVFDAISKLPNPSREESIAKARQQYAWYVNSKNRFDSLTDGKIKVAPAFQELQCKLDFFDEAAVKGFASLFLEKEKQIQTYIKCPRELPEIKKAYELLFRDIIALNFCAMNYQMIDELESAIAALPNAGPATQLAQPSAGCAANKVKELEKQ